MNEMFGLRLPPSPLVIVGSGATTVGSAAENTITIGLDGHPFQGGRFHMVTWVPPIEGRVTVERAI